MADKEKNLPFHDPENQENEIVNHPPTSEEASLEDAEAVENNSDVFDKDSAVSEEVEAVSDSDEISENRDDTQATEEPVVQEPAAEEPVKKKSAKIPSFDISRGDAWDDDDYDEYIGDPEDDEETVEPEDEEPAVDDGIEKFEINVDKYGEISLKNKIEADEVQVEDEIDPEDLIVFDDVIKAIKFEGERIDSTEEKLNAYLRHSKDAIKSFEKALKIGQRALDNNKNDKESPSILAGNIKICAQILEIKCNNLENFVRVKAHEYIKNARTSLHVEIERYNDMLIMYSSITGEQLTRMSGFLPESICSGKSLAVVPVLFYRERYVQIMPEEPRTREEEATLTIVEPFIDADTLIGEIAPPRSSGKCKSYARKAKRATKRLNSECTKISKLLSETKSLHKRYENEISGLEKRTSLAQRATDEYKERLLDISVKYGKEISGIKTFKTQNAFARTRLRLMINRLAIEREKLVVAYEYWRNICRAGKLKQKRFAQKYIAAAINSYNKCAELCTNATGTKFSQIPIKIIEQIASGEEIQFPKIAYKRELIETVGSTSRYISMALRSDIAPDEQAYAETAGRVFEKGGSAVNTSSLSDESAAVDRASAIAKIMLEALSDSAEMVLTVDELEQFSVKSDKTIKYFKKARKMTEKAMSRAYDENGVITALVENLRVIANLIEVRRINISVASRLKRDDMARHHSRALYKEIELYNGRAIDYMSLVGEQFSRITISTARELAKNADKLKVPVITYRDNYIEVFPKDPLNDSEFQKPRLWRSGVYTPLLMKHYRLTENRAVETTVINSPFVFDVMTDEMPAVSWWHPIGFWQHLFIWTQPIRAWWDRVCTNVEIWFVDESLAFSKSGIKGRNRRNTRKKSRYERKIKKLNVKYNAELLNLETVVHETDRHSHEYQKKLYKINEKYSRKIYRLKLRWMEDCPGRNQARLLLECLVLERERLAGINKVILKYRSYGRITFTRNILVKYKKRFIDAITAHNATAEKLSEIVGIKFAQVSTSVAEEIIRYGNLIKFPEIICCREVIETINGKERAIGDRWHGYGLYTGTGGSASENGRAPIMSVGAMGYATDMGVPFLRSTSDSEGMTIMGMTPGGVPLIGFTNTGETSIPFTGIPMMLSGSDKSVILDAGLNGQDGFLLGAVDSTDPYTGLHKRGIDARYTEEIEEDARDIHSGCEVETPLDLPSKMVEERFTRALKARSMVSVDNIANWWKLVGSEINVRLMRWILLRDSTFLPSLIPPQDVFTEITNKRVVPQDVINLRNLTKVRGLIDIETKKLYAATKTGIRRSQRVWSSWLHDDIQTYNEIVREYNKGKHAHTRLEPLSLNIPDTIIFRKEDRPPAPPELSLRNRVRVLEDAEPITVFSDENGRGGIFNAIIDYALQSAQRMSDYDRRPSRRGANILYIILMIPYRIVDFIFEFFRNLRLNITVFRLRRLRDRQENRITERARRRRERGEARAARRRNPRAAARVIRRSNRRSSRLIRRFDRRNHNRMLKLASKIIKIRMKKAYARRQDNEFRHYRIRYEKSRNMKRYNKRTIGAVGMANDPIKYQSKMHKSLRDYLSRNFRIDYNMRIRQLIYRFTPVNNSMYFIVLGALVVGSIISYIIAPSYELLMILACIVGVWAVVLPVLHAGFLFIYDIVLFIASLILLITRNIWLIRYGARDVERNRYGIVLDCFVTEHYRLLFDCEELRQNPRSTSARKTLISTVNDYNKRAEIFADVLKIPVKPIEITSLIEKLTSGKNHSLYEIPSIVYVRELVERVDKHQVGTTMKQKELKEIVAEINQFVTQIGERDDRNNPDPAIVALGKSVNELIHYITTDKKPTQTKRFDLKADIIYATSKLPENLANAHQKEIFCDNIVKVIDQIGGRDSRRIISILAVDDMITPMSDAIIRQNDRRVIRDEIDAIVDRIRPAEGDPSEVERLAEVRAGLEEIYRWAKIKDNPGSIFGKTDDVIGGNEDIVHVAPPVGFRRVLDMTAYDIIREVPENGVPLDRNIRDMKRILKNRVRRFLLLERSYKRQFRRLLRRMINEVQRPILP